MPKQVWTTYRRLMSNLVPALFCVPLFMVGVLFYQTRQIPLSIAFWAATPIAGWIGVNFFGLFQNRQMMEELATLLRERRPTAQSVFVGFARPSHHSPIDAHEDVGWFMILPDRVEFVGERFTFAVSKEEVIGVRFRFNAHTLLGLGRWVSIEGKRDGKPIRMLIEPRQEASFLANKRLGSRLLRQLRQWAKGKTE